MLSERLPGEGPPEIALCRPTARQTPPVQVRSPGDESPSGQECFPQGWGPCVLEKSGVGGEREVSESGPLGLLRGQTDLDRNPGSATQEVGDLGPDDSSY